MLTGSGGILGSYLLPFLKEKDPVTIAVDIFFDKADKNHVQLNLNNSDHVVEYAEICTPIDVVIFLVGLAHSKGKGKDLPAFQQVNCQTLVNLLSALKTFGKTPSKIIFASTISVYGERYDQNRYNETLEPSPFSPYAVTKLQAERYLLDNYADRSWILRLAPVYSPDFLLNINRRTKMRHRYYKVGKGEKKLSLCNIENIKTVIDGIIEEEVPAGVYNISDPIAYTYKDLLKHQGASFVFRIPVLAIRLLYILGRITNNIFLKENSIKLITDNIFPSDKIQKYIRHNSTINDLKILND